MDCGCGGGSDCITKHKKEFKKWMEAELKRLDCGCGCKGMKKFEEKYGKLVGGKLKDCPPGWRNDGLTCVKNCEPGEKDDGLTCRKPCESGFVDDGLTCRKPITSSMNDCPQGSKDIWGTCWGPVRRDCIDDCFKHPAPGCKTTQCGRLEWAGIDWGPKLCTSCNLRCGQTCWDVWGITKQLHERELKVTGGEVQPKSIYSKEIRGRIDFEATNKEIEQAFIDAFGNDSELAKAFDPEKNGVAEAFRKFGVNTKEAFDDIGRKIKEGFEKSLTPEFRAWWESEQRGRKRGFERFKRMWGERLGPLTDPAIWIDIAITFAEIAGVLIATGVAVSTFGAGTAASAAMIMAINMIGPSVRMIVKASKGEEIDAFDIIELMLAAVPAPGKNDKAAVNLLGRMFQFVQRNKGTIQMGANILLAGARFGQMLGKFPSTCIANCPERDDSTMPPPDNPNPPYFPPMDPPPPGQKTDAELLAMAPGNKPFVKYLTDSDDVNPDYVKMTQIGWIKKKRQELYNWPTPTETVTTPEGNLITPGDAEIVDATTVEPDKTEQNINPSEEEPEKTPSEENKKPSDDFDLDTENAGFGRYRGGAFDFVIEPEMVGNEVINPGGEMTTKPPSGKEPPKGPGGCEFNVKCYAQNYPDLFNELKRDEPTMTAYWTDVGKEQGHNPCCGAKLEQGKNYEENHVKCNARNGFYDKTTGKCDISRNTKGIRKTRLQFKEDQCKAEGNFWDKGYEIYVTEERTQPDFWTGKYEIRRTEHTRPTGPAKCDPKRNLQGKNKEEEAAKQQAEANKRTIDRIVKDDFFPACYAANNPDVVAKVGNTDEVLEKHFREYGINEQRSSRCDATLQEQKVAANKAKALESFNPFCYAYNNPSIFNPIWEAYSQKIQRGERPNQSEITETLRKHFMDVGYAQKLDYSCAARDTEYNWRCFSENMRTIGNASYAGVAFDSETSVNRYWETQKNNSWETFNKGSCRDKDISKSQKVRDFNAKCYAYNNPELRIKFGNNDSAYLEHYRSEGFDQGLDTSCDARNQAFKPECYGLANPDLNQDVGALNNHWNSSGKNEWRNINCTPEQAETVYQKYYCQDTESFWDGTTCDLTRHTNGRPKEEISNETLEAYYKLFPENEREQARIDTERRMEIDISDFNLLEGRLACEKVDGWFEFTKVEGSVPIELTCNLNRNAKGESKKQLCAQQNEYYDEITRMCDSSRDPDGLTETQREIKMAEEAELERQEEIRIIQHKREIQQYFDEVYDALVEKEWLPAQYKEGQLVTLKVSGIPSWKIYERNNRTGVTMVIHKSRPDSTNGQLLWKERPDLIDVGKLDDFLKSTQDRLDEIKEQTETITDPVLLQKIDDCKNYAKKYNLPNQQESYFDIEADACLYITPFRTKCIEEGGKYKSNYSRNPELHKEPECIPAGTQLESETPLEPLAPVAPIAPVTTPIPVEKYDNNKIYKVGDLVNEDGIVYKMIDGIGVPGYPPPRPTNWEPVPTGSGKSSLTLYWARWCPHCHDVLPMWKKLAFKGVQINALEEQETDFQVDGYPTIIFRNGNHMEKYTGKRTKAAILKFLKNKLS